MVQYQEEVSNLLKQVDNLQNLVAETTSLDTKVNGLQTENTNLNNKIKQLESSNITQIVELEKELKLLTQQKEQLSKEKVLVEKSLVETKNLVEEAKAEMKKFQEKNKELTKNFKKGRE